MHHTPPQQALFMWSSKNPLQPDISKLSSGSRGREKRKNGLPHNAEKEIPAYTVYTNPEWKQYSFVILSRRCWSSVRVGGWGGGARLPLQPLLWLAPQTGSSDPLIGRRATQSRRLEVGDGERERGSRVGSRHLWVNREAIVCRADNLLLGHRWS